MSVYLQDIPLHQAQARFQEALAGAGLWQTLGSESIDLNEDALGRTLAEPIWARISSPHYHAAAMDGFAVLAEATSQAQPTSPVDIAVEAIGPSRGSPKAIYLDTGDPLPIWANAIIPIENVEPLDEGGRIAAHPRKPAAIRIRASVTPWSHVRPLGEDIVATQLILAAGQVLRPVDLGAIAASGHDHVVVARKPKVAVVPTGSELVPIGSEPEPGKILEYNSLVLATQVMAMGGECTRYSIATDDLDSIARNVSRAAEDHDLVLLNAGSSAGSEDFSAQVIARLGKVLVHGVAVRPGHPVILGMVRRNSGDSSAVCPIIGVPGYPVSAALTVDIFVEPIMAKWLGRSERELDKGVAELTRKITSPAGDEDYIRVALGKVAGKLLAAPLSRGAGVITSLVQADGIVIVPPGIQGMEAGEHVEVRLYRTSAEIQRTIFCIGSHDLTLDLLAAFLGQRGRRLVSANVGSQGGLIALSRGHGHLAGSHLLDPESGEYNIPYIRQYLPGMRVEVIALVGREQGMIVKAGNPKGIRAITDLARSDVVFVNRQRGAGTRVLLDYYLNSKAISPQMIRGYNQQEYTHLGVAAAVASGRADCGLGIAAAAQALGLEFIPMFKERYDLVIPSQHAGSELLAPLIEVLNRPDFQAAVSKLPGYDISVMGKVILEDP